MTTNNPSVKISNTCNQVNNDPWLKRIRIKPLLLMIFLVVMTCITSYLSIVKQWQLPIQQLFSFSAELSVADLAKQLTLLPTMIVAICAGGILGVVSLLLQQLVKNPLASDTTLAVGSGAQMALLLVTLFLPNYGLYGNFWVAFIGAILSMALVFMVSLPSRMNPLVLVVAGLIVNIFITAVSSLCLVFFSEKSLGVMAWGGGILTQIGWGSAQLLSAASLVMFVVLIPLLKPLTLMSLDDRQAKSLGVPVSLVRGTVVLLVAVLTALVVSEVGMLSFVGLGAATLVNVLAFHRLVTRLLVGFIFGAMLLLLASNIVTLLMSSLPMLIPAGTITGILGAPLIIWIILQQKRQRAEQITPNFSAERRPLTSKFWVTSILSLIALFVFVIVFTNTINGWQFSLNQELISQFRLPRSLSALATGCMLAAAGVLVQTLTRNPMASPEVLGVSSGAAVGVLLAVVIVSVLGTPISLMAMLIGGTVGSLLVLALILWLARFITPSYLLLVGIAITAIMSSILSLIKLSGDPRLQAVLSWLSGTTYSSRPQTVWWLVSIGFVFCVASVLLIKALRVLSLGSAVAKGVGVNVNISQLLIMIVVAVLSAASTLAVGPLSFVGLMVPHLATSLGAIELHKQLPLAMLLGASLMLVADWLGRYLIFPYEIPAGTLAAVIGGIYFIVIIRRVKVYE